MMTHHFRVTNNISPSKKKVWQRDHQQICFRPQYLFSEWFYLIYFILSPCSYPLFVPDGCGSELMRWAARYSPHMLGLRLTLKHCNCHISQELIWSEPEPVFLLSSSGPPRLRLYRRHSASGGRRHQEHREHIPSLSSQSRHHNWTRFMEWWSHKKCLQLLRSPSITCHNMYPR